MAVTKVTIVDSLVNANPKSLNRVREIVGEELGKNLFFTKVDLVNKDELDKALAALVDVNLLVPLGVQRGVAAGEGAGERDGLGLVARCSLRGLEVAHVCRACAGVELSVPVVGQCR